MNAAQARQIERLLEQFRLARHRLFGPSSKKAAGQSELFNEAEVLAATAHSPDQEELQNDEISPRSPPAHRTRGVRKPLPAELPRVQIRHTLPEEQRRCPCGCELKLIGEEVSEQLDVIPARIQVLRHVRERYACSACERARPTRTIRGTV